MEYTSEYQFESEVVVKGDLVYVFDDEYVKHLGVVVEDDGLRGFAVKILSEGVLRTYHARQFYKI